MSNFERLLVYIFYSTNSKLHCDDRGVAKTECNGFRVKICKNPFDGKPSYRAEWVAVFLTDSKVHAMPDSNSIILDDAEAA